MHLLAEHRFIYQAPFGRRGRIAQIASDPEEPSEGLAGRSRTWEREGCLQRLA